MQTIYCGKCGQECEVAKQESFEVDEAYGSRIIIKMTSYTSDCHNSPVYADPDCCNELDQMILGSLYWATA